MLGKHFLHPAGCGSVFPAKSHWDAWGSAHQLVRDQVNMADEPKLRSPIIQFLKHLLCDVWLDIVLEKNWALSIDQCQVQALQFSVHLIDLLSILLRCNGFTGIQKAVVDQTQQTTSDHDLLCCKFGFGMCFGVSSQSSNWADHHIVILNPLFIAHHSLIEKWFVVFCIE